MFFSIAFLSDFIIDYILVLYFSVAFFISFIFKFFSLGFFGGGCGVCVEMVFVFWIFRTDLKENFSHQVSFLKKSKNFLNTSLGSNVSHTLHPYMPIKITSQLTYTQLIKNHKIETLP